MDPATEDYGAPLTETVEALSGMAAMQSGMAAMQSGADKKTGLDFNSEATIAGDGLEDPGLVEHITVARDNFKAGVGAIPPPEAKSPALEALLREIATGISDLRTALQSAAAEATVYARHSRTLASGQTVVGPTYSAGVAGALEALSKLDSTIETIDTLANTTTAELLAKANRAKYL